MKNRSHTLLDSLQIVKNKENRENNILNAVYTILHENQLERIRISNSLASESSTKYNNFNFDSLEYNRIYPISAIKKISIDYRLRFLSSDLFKNQIPEEAITKISELEKVHNTQLDGFKILAPSNAFLLKKYDDPLLFVPLNENYYYLVHEWGNNINPLRKLSVLPLKNLGTFVTTCLFISALISFIVPTNNLSKSIPMAQFIVFIFTFKSIIAVILYYFFMMGKNFNENIWKSPFIEN